MDYKIQAKRILLKKFEDIPTLNFFMEQYLLILFHGGSKEVEQSPMGRNYKGTDFHSFQKQRIFNSPIQR